MRSWAGLTKRRVSSIWRSRKLSRSEEHTLNSSHDQISYAVFCLKKKKEQAILRIQLEPAEEIAQPVALHPLRTCDRSYFVEHKRRKHYVTREYPHYEMSQSA